MKKMIALAMLVCMCGVALFAQIGPDGTKEEQTQAENTDIKNIQLAYSLADYGWENDSATALLEAAEILSGIPTQSGTFEKETNGTSIEKSKNETKDYSVEKLLKDARNLFGKDKTLDAWAKRIEKASKTVTRGASGGPLYDFSYAPGKGGAIYHIWYDGGRLAEFFVSSLDGADLDVYVYDDRGNLLCYDERYNMDAYAFWYPRYRGRFTIKIKNNSRYSADFMMFTN